MIQNAIETPRLRLQTMQAEDTDALLNIFADPKVMAAFHSSPFQQEQMVQWVQRNLDHQVEYGYGLFSVIHKADAVLIGDCGLEVITLDGNIVAELGYDFRSDYWNQGYATEAATAIRDYAFETLHREQLVSLIRVGNHASRRVAEKVGMHLTQEIVRYAIPYWQYAIVPSDILSTDVTNRFSHE